MSDRGRPVIRVPRFDCQATGVSPVTVGKWRPDHAVVLCVDEKTQIQALERTRPMLPLGLGYVEGVTHDYHRHGMTTLFAALDVVTGRVLSQCKEHHRHQEFLSFLQQIDRNVPRNL